MTESINCEYCNRPIIHEPVKKILRGNWHTFCTEFCFRLFFYDVPAISYDDLKKMYELRCVDVKPPDFRSLVVEED